MKRFIFSLVIGSVLFSILFLSCDNFVPPDVNENTTAENADLERKDVLALKHLQIPNVSEDTLASYVMDFFNVTTTSETGTERSVQSAPAVVITKTTKLTHDVETGFAETTADKRSARSVIGPGQIPFYVFTLENQQTGKTGFALACGDNRIGEILAVIDEGRYDDDNPGLNIFYTCLNAYIEDTIAIYNGITEADIENAMNKIDVAARATASSLPVTFEGHRRDFDGKSRTDYLLNCIEFDGIQRQNIKWDQADPFNRYLNKDIKKITDYTHYGYVTGCGPVAMAQIMAYHQRPKIHGATSNEVGLGHQNITFNWDKMMPAADDKIKPDDDNKELDYKEIGKLMYHIGIHANASYKWGSLSSDNPQKKGDAETSTTDNGVIIAFYYFGYKVGVFKAYSYSGVTSSIDKKKPVMAGGRTDEINILGIIKIPSGSGHYWVIDGYFQLEIKNKATGEIKKDPSAPKYVHCNMGWGGIDNGWYIDGVFNADNVPWKDDSRSAEPYNYKYRVRMLTDITY